MTSQRVHVINESLLFGFFEQSEQECQYLIGVAQPHMAKSTVVDSKTGKSKDSRYASLFCPSLSCRDISARIRKTFVEVHIRY